MLVLLRDPELTRNLLEYINDTPGGRRSVSRIARTCKALSDPALNVLWKDLDSLIPPFGSHAQQSLQATPSSRPWICESTL